MANTMIGFGASTMQGVGDSAGGFFSRAERLAGDGRRWVNLGVGGNSTADMLRRIDQVTQHTLRDVVVILGCNDLPRAGDKWPQNRLPLDAYAANLAALLPAIRGGRSLFVTSFGVSEIKTGVSPADFARYMAAAVDAARSAGYDVWDLHQELLGREASFWAPDALHFNDAGHDYIAHGVVERLKR